MEPGTLVALGAMLISAAAVALNLYQAARKRKKEEDVQSAEYIRAQSEMRLGSIEASERIISLYTNALNDVKLEVSRLRKRVEQLEHDNEQLQQLNNTLKHKLSELGA